MADRLGALDLVEAFQLSHAVAALHDLRLMSALSQPRTTEELAAAHRLDPALLRGTLEYVASRTNLLRKTGGRFVATRHYGPDSRFMLDLYLGAYGQNAARLADLLQRPSLASAVVDAAQHARAFEGVNGAPLSVLPDIIRSLRWNHVLDLGCGNAGLLLDLAANDTGFAGWGVDLNPRMCKVARSRLAAADVKSRVRVFHGDCRRVRDALPQSVRSKVLAITACNVANEMFSKGADDAVSWLRHMSSALPGRPLLIADYYARLGGRAGSLDRHTVVHDYAQLISGQGVPPTRAAEWQTIYRRAGCRLVHRIEDRQSTRFVHLVQLGEISPRPRDRDRRPASTLSSA